MSSHDNISTAATTATTATTATDVKRWVEVLEYQRRSAVVWRAPFLANDPPPFEIIKGHSTSKYTASYFLQTLHEYQLPNQFVWDGEWNILIQPGKTDEEGWSYAVKFDSENFSIDNKHCYFVRKRKYIREYKKSLTPDPNSPAQGNNKITAANSNTPQVWFSVTEQPSNHNVPTLTEHIIFEVETRELMSRNWKPHNALWFTSDMKPLHIVRPHDLPLPSATAKGEWLWAEGWSIILPSSENIQSARSIHDENNRMLEGLKSIDLLLPETKKGTAKGGLSTSGRGSNDNTPSLTPVSPHSTSDVGDFDLNEREDSKFVKMMNKLKGSGDSQHKEEKKSGGFGDKLKSMIKIDSKAILPRKNSHDNDKGSREPSKNKSSDKNSDLKRKKSKNHDDEESSQSRGSVASSISRPTSIHDELDDHTNLETHDRNGWMYCHKFTNEAFRWKSTDSPNQRHVYRRRIWVRAAVWHPKTSNKMPSLQPERSTLPARSGPVDNSNAGIPVDPSEYFMTELLSGLIWHVHLMSHESIVNLLPKEGIKIDKESLGKSNANKELATGKQIEYRKREVEDTTNLNQRSTPIPNGGDNIIKNDKGDSYTTKIADMTKSVVVGTLSTLRAQKIFIYQRVSDLYFVEDIAERSTKFNDLMTALKGLQFHYEPLKIGDTRSTLKYHLQSSGPNGQAGALGLCDKIFEMLAEVLSECIFHSSTHVYADADRRRLLQDLAEIGTLYSNLKKTKLVSNVSQLALLLQTYIRSIHKGESDHDSEVNPLWIIDDLFHMKQKFANLPLDQIQQLCLFFPDMLTNMKHLSWIIRRVCEERKELDELNAKLCQLELQRGQRTLEQWLKCLHDSVKPHVVAEVIMLYMETSSSKDDVSGKQQATYSDYATFMLECIKISADTAYSKIKAQYDIATVLNNFSQQTIAKSNSAPTEDNPKKTKDADADADVDAEKVEKPDTEEPSVEKTKHQEDNSDHENEDHEEANDSEAPVAEKKIEQKKEKPLDLLEYFRDERKKKEWFEFVEEIELLIKDDSNISIMLWDYGIFSVIPDIGMETLALGFVSDIINLLASNQESLELAYRILLTGAYRLQLLLQRLCYKYAYLQRGKVETEEHHVVVGVDDGEDTIDEEKEKETVTKSVVVDKMRHTNLDDMFGDSAFTEELMNMGQSAAHQRVDQIFSFVQMEVTTRLQNWMERSLQRTGEAVERAARMEKWESEITRELDKSEDDEQEAEQDGGVLRYRERFGHQRGRSQSADRQDEIDQAKENKITWADFVTDSFLFIDNEINAYFVNIKSFPPEAMGTAEQFYGHLFLLIQYILKIVNSAFAEFAGFGNQMPTNQRNQTLAFGDELRARNQPKKVMETIEDPPELPQFSDVEVLVPRKETKTITSQIISNVGKGIAEIGNMNRRAFGLVFSTVDTVQEGVKDLNNTIKEMGTRTVSTFTKNIDVLENQQEMHLLEERQFKKELKHVCVKLSSISRVLEIVGEFGQRLLRYVQDLEEPKEPHLKEKYEDYRQMLVQSAHSFVTKSKEIVNSSLCRAAAHMSIQFLDVQNQHYFSFELYRPATVESTTAVKLGLLEKLFEYLARCDDYLRPKDLRVLTVCLASFYAKRMRSVLIGRTPRIFRIQDNEVVIKDFDELFELLASFNPMDFDAQRCPLNSEENPLYTYYSVLELMKTHNSELFHQHVLVMAQRSEVEEKLEMEREKKEDDEIREKLKDPRYKKREERIKLFSLASLADKLVRKRNQLKRIHDHPVLHVLAHRADEEAQTYVQNFVQYRNKNQPLLIDFHRMNDILRVIVHSGKNLLTNSNQTIDPYVKVTVHGITKSTRIVRRTLNPSWQQALDFDLSENILRAIKKAGGFLIRFEVMDWDPSSSNDFIGQHKIKVLVNQDDIQEKSLNLLDEQNNADGDKRGELSVTIEVKNLWVSVKAARDEDHSSLNTEADVSRSQRFTNGIQFQKIRTG